MDTSRRETPRRTLAELRAECARNDERFAQAMARLAALGPGPLLVPRHVLEAFDAACLVRISPLDPSAIRG